MRILRDKREKRPWNFEGLGVEIVPVTLNTGDYQLPGAFVAAVERKSIQDIVGTLDRGLERFLKECGRLSQYRKRAIIIEGTVSDIEKRGYAGRISPAAIFEHLERIETVMGVQVVWAVNPKAAQRMAYEFFRWAEVTANKGDQNGSD